VSLAANWPPLAWPPASVTLTLGAAGPIVNVMLFAALE